jgi:hypothetical protein
MAILNFKAQLQKDINVFFNVSEFADSHTLDGKVINCVVDNERLIERSKKEYDGISVGELLIFVKENDINKNLKQGMPIVFDGKQMSIFNIRKDMGIYEIILSQNLE